MLPKIFLVSIYEKKTTEFKCGYLVTVCVVENDMGLSSDHRNCLGFKKGSAIDLTLVFGP